MNKTKTREEVIPTKWGEITVTVYESDGKKYITPNSLKEAAEPFGSFSLPITDVPVTYLLGYPVVNIIFKTENGEEFVGTGYGNPETMQDKFHILNLPNTVINRAKSDALFEFFELEGKYFPTDFMA